jgi:tetratricopeptide (TPR) repeat protein
MGLFDKFRRKHASPEQDEAAELFEQIEAALDQPDEGAFEALCREHADAIVEAFPSWRRVDQELAPERVQAIVKVLGSTARHLAEQLDRPGPWELLTGAAEDDPFARWEAATKLILQRVEVLDYTGAVAQAEALLEDFADYGGPARDQHDELIRGLLGQLLRQVARPDAAEPLLEWTLGRCLAHGDDEGTGVYLEALHEAERDRGRPSAWAERLADYHDQHSRPEQAAWLRAVARRYPQGEPPLRMIVLVEGRRYELDEADAVLRGGHSVDVVFERGRQTLAAAIRWTERGREHGGQGELDDAIACFVAAAEADPHDPECRNLHAFTLMLMDRPDLALPLYQQVEELAPGWFHTRTWRSLAQRQLVGELSHEAILVVHTLQDGELSAEDRLSLVNQALSRWPRVPELHLYRGVALAELGRDPEHAWLAGLEVCEGVPATRSRLLQALGRIDEVLALEGGNLMALAAATLQRRVGELSD